MYDLVKPAIPKITSSRQVRKSTRAKTLESIQQVFKWDWWRKRSCEMLSNVLDDIGIIWCFDRKVVNVDVVKMLLKEKFWPMKLHPDTSFDQTE